MWACLALLAVPAGAQDTDNNVRGMVVDKWGHPVYGASVMVKGMPETRVETDKDGKFSIEASAGQQLNIVSVDKGTTTVKADGKSLVKVVLNYAGSLSTWAPDVFLPVPSLRQPFLPFIMKTLISVVLKTCLILC